MDSSQFFRRDIIDHKRRVYKHINTISKELMHRAFEHDNDKIEDDLIFDIYNEHSQTQRSIPFGTKERIDFEHITMGPAVDKHIHANRHHLYNSRNPLSFEHANLLDYIEILCDWKSAMERNELSEEDEIERIKFLLDKYNFPEDIKVAMLNTYHKLKKSK